VAEGLVFQELQNELGGTVVRQVSVRLGRTGIADVDGIVQAGGKKIAVEVRLMRARPNPARVAEMCERMKRDFQRLAQHLNTSKSIAAFVLYGSDVVEEGRTALMVQAGRLLEGVAEVRVFAYEDLLRKYGFPTEQTAKHG
jgi:hypothetical protein